MMRSVAILMMVILVAASAGCAKKTASQQLQDDMKEAGQKMEKELDSWK